MLDARLTARAIVSEAKQSQQERSFAPQQLRSAPAHSIHSPQETQRARSLASKSDASKLGYRQGAPMPQDSHQSPDEVANAATTAEPTTKPQTDSPSPQATAAEPSGYKGDNPATAGPGQTTVHSNTPENALGRLNPSAPEDANVTPGSTTVK